MLYFCEIAFQISVLLLNHSALDSVLKAGFQSFLSVVVGKW
jgi:hypothetical protein